MPMMTSRPTAFVTSLGLVSGAYFQLVQLSAPLLTTNAIASTWNRGMNVSSLMLGGVISSSLFSLVPTLRFTNKVGNMGCLIMVLAVFLGGGFYDAYRYVFVLEMIFAGNPEYLATMKSIMGLVNSSGVNQLLIGGTVLTIMNAFRKKSKTE